MMNSLTHTVGELYIVENDIWMGIVLTDIRKGIGMTAFERVPLGMALGRVP
jgi:hypothetical protein